MDNYHAKRLESIIFFHNIVKGINPIPIDFETGYISINA